MGDQELLQYLIGMGDLAPEDDRIKRMEMQAQALRQGAMPSVPQQGRVATRMPGNSWFPMLAGTLAGGIQEKRATMGREQQQGKRDALFQALLKQKQTRNPGPQYPTMTGDTSGYGDTY